MSIREEMKLLLKILTTVQAEVESAETIEAYKDALVRHETLQQCLMALCWKVAGSREGELHAN